VEGAAGEVAQGIGPEIKPQSCNKKRKKETCGYTQGNVCFRVQTHK
jgi:hypothetical protein